jgi:RND superfamily putative drug exporter
MLSAGGFTDPDAESNRASRILIDEYDHGVIPLYLLVQAPGQAAASPAPRAAVDEIVAELRTIDDVVRVTSPWEVPDPVAAGLLSRDRQSALVIAQMRGDDNAGFTSAGELAKQFEGQRSSGVNVMAGGPGAVSTQVADQSRKDLTVSEAIALPISFAVLVWVFNGLIAALIPLAVGTFAILGSLAILRGLAEITEVSAFAPNLAAALGLALAIDYSLLLVNRYREEIADDPEPHAALRRTMRSAGRTVVYSALTVALCLAMLAVYPMYFLRSFAYAGVSVVALAAAAALVIAPAAILVTATRIGKGRRRVPLDQSRWYAWAMAVMRRPAVAVVMTMIPLVIVGLPFLDVNFGYTDDRILPASAAARQVGDQIRSDFSQEAGAAVPVVIEHSDAVEPAALDRYASELSRVTDVLAVSTPVATYSGGVAVGPPTPNAGARDTSNLLTVATATEPFSARSAEVLDRLHEVAEPAGTEALFAGPEQANRDGIDSVASRLPLLLGLIAAVMFVLLFLLSGSVVIPLKALLLNTLSLTATFGAMVWIFQEGHLGGLGTTAIGTLIATMPVLMFCITFGLSMDYEVFLISRIREHWLASDRTHDANVRAVALGLASTGRIVTAGALIMAVAFAGLIASQVSIMRLFGVGLTVAVLVDATLIRSVLLPAVMVWLGRWNWWAPAPLARLHQRLSR